MSRCLIFGAYGLGNVGDEAVLSGTLEYFKNKYERKVVISFSPKLTTKIHNVDAIHLLNPLIIWKFIFASAVIQGGGGILDYKIANVKNNLAIYILCFLILGRILGKKRIIHRVGFEGVCPFPFSYFLNFALSKAFISTRDKESALVLKSKGIEGIEGIKIFRDAAFDMPIYFNKKKDREKKEIALAIRYVQNEKISKQTKITIRKIIAEFGKEINFKFIIFQKHKFKKIENDYVTALDICNDDSMILPFSHAPQENLVKIADFDLVIAGRFHANVFSYLLKIPSIPISYNTKIDNFARENLKIQKILSYENLTFDKLCREIKKYV